jgi:hypothetical protein
MIYYYGGIMQVEKKGLNKKKEKKEKQKKEKRLGE